jgi:hypothetical protein
MELRKTKKVRIVDNFHCNRLEVIFVIEILKSVVYTFALQTIGYTTGYEGKQKRNSKKCRRYLFDEKYRLYFERNEGK